MTLKNSIRRVVANLSGFSARLLFDATTDVYAWQIPSDFPTDNHFQAIANIPNPLASGNTGDVVITTSGLGTGDSGTIVLYVEKN